MLPTLPSLQGLSTFPPASNSADPSVLPRLAAPQVLASPVRPHLGMPQLPSFSQGEKGKEALNLGLSDDEDEDEKSDDNEQKVAETKQKGMEKVPKLSRKVSASSVLDGKLSSSSSSYGLNMDADR